MPKYKIVAIVVAFKPTHALLQNINSYLHLVDHLFIFDNTEENKLSMKESLSSNEKITYLHDGFNDGIAKRLNQGCQMAMQLKADFVLTFDQDSMFASNMGANYISCIENYGQIEKAAAFGTVFGTINQENKVDCSSTPASDLITSGMMLNLKAYCEIGPFDENLFIDLVDHEYCARAFVKGFKTIRFNNIYLTHHVGSTVYRASIKTLYLVKKHKHVHSPLRYYYMYRNMLYLTDIYSKNGHTAFVKEVKKLVNSNVQKGFLYGRFMMELIKYLRLAKQHYKQGKMGKYS